MALECNIDAKGKAVRLRLGLMGVVSSLGLAAGCLLISAPDLAWIIPAGAFVGGHLLFSKDALDGVLLERLGLELQSEIISTGQVCLSGPTQDLRERIDNPLR